jgi:hypothetical protein
MTPRAIGQVLFFSGVGVAIAVSILYATKSTAQNAGESRSEGNAAPIYGITIPSGYREWQLISLSHLAADKSDDPALVEARMALKQLRAQLGNDIAIKAFREGKLPFPDGAMIAALHWNEASSDENDKVLVIGFPGAGLQSSVPKSAVNVQFMLKDSKKYAASGGWGFADFTNGKPGNEALHKTCFGCHQPAKDHDYVFTRYAPTP